jgi:hypothetical protein
MKFRLVQRDGVDTLHRNPSFEECQVDDADKVVALTLSMEEANRIADEATGSAHACLHCRPLDG